MKVRWRLKPGAPTELQHVIDDQTKIRKDEWERLTGERSHVQGECNDLAKVARRNPDERALVKEFSVEKREQFQSITKQIAAIDSYRVIVYPYLRAFDLPIEDYAGMGPIPTGTVGFPDRDRDLRKYGIFSKAVLGHYPLTGATVVSVVDAHSAVVRPRALSEVALEIRDPDKFYVWAHTRNEMREREPVLALGLPDTTGWKAGDVVGVPGQHFILRPLPDDAEGKPPSPEISMEPFDPALIEPIS